MTTKAQLCERNQEQAMTILALRGKLLEMQTCFRILLGVGESDEWECEHGAQVSEPCFPDCHLNRTRRVLGFIK